MGGGNPEINAQLPARGETRGMDLMHAGGPGIGEAGRMTVGLAIEPAPRKDRTIEIAVRRGQGLQGKEGLISRHGRQARRLARVRVRRQRAGNIALKAVGSDSALASGKGPREGVPVI